MVAEKTYSTQRDRLCVFFSGMGMGFNKYDWEKYHLKLGYNCLLLTDENKRYYTDGVPQWTTSEQDTADKIKGLGYKEVCLVGSSMGGYGAIVAFQKLQLLGQKARILVFNPKTTFSGRDIGGVYSGGKRMAVFGSGDRDIYNTTRLSGFERSQIRESVHSYLLSSLKKSGLLDSILAEWLRG